MDLLRETDPMLYHRVLRRLMNHLHWQGVPGVQGLLYPSDPGVLCRAYRRSRARRISPSPTRSVERLDKVFEEALWIASLALLRRRAVRP